MRMKVRYVLYNLCMLFGCICFSCTDPTNELLPSATTGLTIQISTGDGQTFTRAESSEAENTYNNKIQYLDIFIFDSNTGELVSKDADNKCYWHFGGKDEYGIPNDIVDPVLLIPGNWKTWFAGHAECDVYVIANLYAFAGNEDSQEMSQALEDISTLNDLKKIVEENSQIDWPVSVDAKIPFAMSGYVLKWKPLESANIYTIPVELTRLAAKIEVALNLAFEDKTVVIDNKTYTYPTNEDVSQLQYSFKNYAINTLVFPEDNTNTFSPTIESQSSETDIIFLDKEEGRSVPKVIVYTYPTSWSDDVLKEPYVIINVQLKSTDDVGIHNNYYKIPLRLPTQEQKLERNHWYKINATISALGNATPDNPVELTDVHYEVAEWKDMPIEVGNDNPMYLELSEYEVVMRNVDTYDLTFASSSNLKETEEKAEIEIKEIYYYNKDGKKITITDSEILDNTYLKVEGDLNGKLTIHSPIPANKTIRYIELTVKNEQYKENDSGTSSCIKTVTIMQYPLEYITGISGLYSYLDLENDDRYKGIWPTYKEEFVTKLNFTSEDGQYVISTDIQSVIANGLNNHIGTSVDMKSKFYVENASGEGRIFRIDYSYLDEYIEVPWGGTTDNPKVYVRGFIEVENSGNREYIPDKESDGRDKRYNLKILEKENGNYVKIGTDYIEVENGTGHYSIESSKDNGDGEYYFAYIHYTGSDINDITYYLCTTIDNKDYKPELPFYLSDNGTASNNQMYHVVITATSSDYTLARPIMDGDVVDAGNTENDNLVSPSFMLASQLGNSSTIRWQEAQNQCKNYVEVGEDGTVYDDWRLPTAAEIGILIRYQSDSNVNTGNDLGVMDNILNNADKEQGNPYYWVSSTGYYVEVHNSYNKDQHLIKGRDNNDDGCRVRCVRDYRISDE